MGRIDNMRKSDNEIVDRLLKDTKSGSLNWYLNELDMYVYTRVITVDNSNRIDVIFKLLEGLDNDDYFAVEYAELYNDNLVYLDIYMTKNKGNEIFCRRISKEQNKLTELSEKAISVLKNKYGK
jgi:hypothetical protein